MDIILNYVVTVLSIVALGFSTFCMTKVMKIPDPGKIRKSLLQERYI
ncbi:MAG: hypothetical protein K6A76_00430 [Oribacterium sp.]|nr:hypothetical protein [Oribacterium sp.]